VPLVTALITFFSPESDAELPSAEDDAAEPLLLPAFADALLPHPATTPTVIIVTNKAANTRFFIILNLLFVI